MAGWLDVSTATARALVETAARTPELSPQMARLESGAWTFDRATAMARLFVAGADAATLEDAADHDIAGIDQLRAR